MHLPATPLQGLKLKIKMDSDVTNAALNVDRIIKGKIKQLSGNAFFHVVACLLLLVLRWELCKEGNSTS